MIQGPENQAYSYAPECTEITQTSLLILSWSFLPTKTTIKALEQVALCGMLCSLQRAVSITKL